MEEDQIKTKSIGAQNQNLEMIRVFFVFPINNLKGGEGEGQDTIIGLTEQEASEQKRKHSVEI